MIENKAVHVMNPPNFKELFWCTVVCNLKGKMQVVVTFAIPSRIYCSWEWLWDRLHPYEGKLENELSFSFKVFFYGSKDLK